MKKVLLIAVIMVAGIQANAQSNVVKLNILSLVVKTANISYEKVLNETRSFQIGVAYTGASISETHLKGLQITPEYRFYLSETSAPNGVYAAPWIRYSNLSVESGDSKASLTSFGGGAVIGKQWIFKESISLETFLGPGYSSSSVDVEQGTEESFNLGSFDGFGLRFGINFGLAF
jgi:hypothetical protein